MTRSRIVECVRYDNNGKHQVFQLKIIRKKKKIMLIAVVISVIAADFLVWTISARRTGSLAASPASATSASTSSSSAATASAEIASTATSARHRIVDLLLHLLQILFFLVAFKKRGIDGIIVHNHLATFKFSKYLLNMTRKLNQISPQLGNWSIKTNRFAFILGAESDVSNLVWWTVNVGNISLVRNKRFLDFITIYLLR